MRIAIVAAGFTPAQVRRQYDVNRAAKGYEQGVLDRRQYLIDAFAMSVRLQDADGRSAAMQKIRTFNQAHPEIAITGQGLRTSLRARARYSARAEGGVVLNRRLESRAMEEARFGAE